MPNKPTITAAIIEANRAKNPVRHVIDYDHRAACMDVLIREARDREPRKPINPTHGNIKCECPNCFSVYFMRQICFAGNADKPLIGATKPQQHRTAAVLNAAVTF